MSIVLPRDAVQKAPQDFRVAVGHEQSFEAFVARVRREDNGGAALARSHVEQRQVERGGAARQAQVAGHAAQLVTNTWFEPTHSDSGLRHQNGSTAAAAASLTTLGTVVDATEVPTTPLSTPPPPPPPWGWENDEGGKTQESVVSILNSPA
eukprot:CAMPEP_0171599548 /NCGR_PEP_ID=MMETSP0990-20121206/3789_1 /TAXON_ID=483369 /ORGANISM="non described non described, Strain CCMP2098" /LENGTH=150 /DNA_ID=CAMNT_0012161327 /DNA_START=112 /DNA_END=565 /DNA_ORIENTATION=+